MPEDSIAKSTPEMEWLNEQLVALKDVIHTYRCFVCNMASSEQAVIIIDENEEGNAVVSVVGICGTCGGIE